MTRGHTFYRRDAEKAKAARTCRIHSPLRGVPCRELRKAQPGYRLARNRRDDTTVTMRHTALRFGYTFRELDELARILVTMDVWHLAWSGFERYEIAFSAMAETLYAAEERPDAHALFDAARREINKKVQEDRKSAGLSNNSGYEHQVNFYRFWWEQYRHSASPEDVVIDGMALRQIFPVLKPRFRRVLVALATHGEHQKAADALGITRATYNDNLSDARHEFFRLWHEHEAPSRLWAQDKRKPATRKTGETDIGDTVMYSIVRRRKRAGKANSTWGRKKVPASPDGPVGSLPGGTHAHT